MGSDKREQSTLTAFQETHYNIPDGTRWLRNVKVKASVCFTCVLKIFVSMDFLICVCKYLCGKVLLYLEQL